MPKDVQEIRCVRYHLSILAGVEVYGVAGLVLLPQRNGPLAAGMCQIVLQIWCLSKGEPKGVQLDG